MPELAEVEFMRRRWGAGVGDVVLAVEAHPRARVFRDCAAVAIGQALTGARLEASARSGKQMIFGFGGAGWLGIHLGMTGELRVEEPVFAAGKHDHLVLRQEARALVFSDARMFGAVRFDAGAEEPAWWRERPPEILDARFTGGRLAEFLCRRARSPIKAVLLMQAMFPGVGNWMADEVLWRAAVHPARAAGSLGADEVTALHRELGFVCRGALRSIVRGDGRGSWGDPPRGWLFHQRWADGGRCPRTGVRLLRETIGGRTTCWSPARQKAPRSLPSVG